MRRPSPPFIAATLAGALPWGRSSGWNRPVMSVEAKLDARGSQRVDVATRSFYSGPDRIVSHADPAGLLPE